MWNCFMPTPLGVEQIDQAFPLVQVIRPGISLEEWQTYASGMMSSTDRRTGIMTVQTQGYIYGLFGYRIEPDLQQGCRLRVEDPVTLDLFHPAGTAAALVAAVDSLTEAFGCTAVHVTRWNSPSAAPCFWRWLIGQFQVKGYLVERQTACNPLR